MRIVHVVTLVSDSGAYGGPVSVATGQLGELAARGHSVELLSLWRGATGPPTSWSGVPLRARTARTLVPGMGFLGLLNLRLLPDLWRAVRTADIVHVHAGRDLVSLAALAVAALCRRTVVVQTHGMVQPRSGLPARLFDRCFVPLLRRARACLVLTEAEHADLGQVLGPDGPALCRLPNGVAKIPGTALGPGRPEVLYLARLHPRKRPEAFVEAAALVARRLPEVTFTLCGADEGCLAAVRDGIARHGLAGRVRYDGPVSHTEALRRVAGATVYVLPSFGEVFPMSLLEALAAGTPTVSTSDCGIAAELHARGAGLVTDGSPQALADAVLGLLEDPGRRRTVVDAGLRAVAEVYSIEAVADRLEELYADG